ncbi:MAG: hypothetical protein LBB58_02200, partial [Cellulomonadaceae bacterium]|nr:hypothetical protein [Cellulomonadaceae bacterium]
SFTARATQLRFSAGGSYTLPVILAHRDVGLSTCPGDDGYASLPAIRAAASTVAANLQATGEFGDGVYGTTIATHATHMAPIPMEPPGQVRLLGPRVQLWRVGLLTISALALLTAAGGLAKEYVTGTGHDRQGGFGVRRE